MGVTIHWRPDWPSDSNAALLAKQRRCSTGASAIGGAATGPTLAGVREAEAARRAIPRAKPAPGKMSRGRVV